MIETFLVHASRRIEAYLESFGERSLDLEKALGLPGKCYILLNIRNYFDKILFNYHDAKIYCQNLRQNNVFPP